MCIGISKQKKKNETKLEFLVTHTPVPKHLHARPHIQYSYVNISSTHICVYGCVNVFKNEIHKHKEKKSTEKRENLPCTTSIFGK